MLKLENVRKNYDRFTLECSLEVQPGCITGLVGQNGAGKSTTFKAILGLIHTDGGRITLLHIPGGPWVRFDTALYQDYFVPPYYDSMIGKLIVYAKTREEAIRKLQAALCELVIEGVDHNSQLHMELLSDPEFKSGDYYTDFMAKKGY